MIRYIIEQLLKIHVSLLSPREGDVLVLNTDNPRGWEQTARGLSNSLTIDIPILVMDEHSNLKKLADMPDEWKERVKKNL